MSKVKKFKDYIKSKKDSSKIESDKGFVIKKDTKQKQLADDITSMKDINEIDLEKLKDTDFKIVGIQDVSLEDPRKMNKELSEAMIVNADFGGKEVKRGDEIWITAMVKKSTYDINSMIVIKCRVVDLYNSLSILNTLR